jgi:hypothetical protein
MSKLDSNQEGVVRTGEVKGETAVAQVRLPVEVRADIAGSPAGDEEVPTPTNLTIVSAEQYLCYLLGFICMGCGSWGICREYSLGLPSGFISWLGPAYGPTLRFTAVACLVSGAVLVRRGLARPDLSSVSGSGKVS